MSVTSSYFADRTAAGRCGAAVLAALLALSLLPACSTSAEDLVPGPRRTGAYPNINERPRVAAEQMTDEEAQANLAALNARRDAIAAEGANVPPSERERLRRLAATHGERTIDEIEN